MKVTGGRELLSLAKDTYRRLSPAEDTLANSASIKLKGQGYSEGAFVIECFYIDFDGTQYGPVNKTFQIRKFEGEKHITSLLVFPLVYDVNEVTIRNKLIERGEKFTKLSNPKKAKHMQYKGLTLDQHQEQVRNLTNKFLFILLIYLFINRSKAKLSLIFIWRLLRSHRTSQALELSF